MRNTKVKPYSLFMLLISATLILSSDLNAQDNTFSIDYEKYTLENGLNVVLHTDNSNPVVAVSILYHVGSSRELPGKTGFAHLFEHILFQESENVPQDEFFKKIQDAGGTLNGGTSYDYTVYYEVVPDNALEKVLWMESDRMGFLENTVTQSAFINQQNVVMNEKRQRVDNQPYGHNGYLINKNIYPEGHPYSWTVIGEMEDLENATLQDVKDFYHKFYGPNNATLVIAGKFDTKETKELVEKYFGEISPKQKVENRKPMNVSLKSTVKLVHEDNFATQPRLTMVWPTVEQYSDDDYALQFLGQILSGNKKSPLYRHLVKDAQMTSGISAYQSGLELAGTFQVASTANEGFTLADLEKGIFESFKIFEEEGITETDLERIKAGLEVSFYQSINNVLNKSISLANYNAFMNNPGYIAEDIKKIQSVTIDDIKRVYDKYIKGKPYVATSFVPKGKPDMAAENSVKAIVVEENIESAASVAQVAADLDTEIKRTPSKIDRSKEPELGADPLLVLPEVWESKLSNGLKVYGIEQDETPLVQFNLVIDGGFRADDLNKLGVANLITDMMMEGTKNKTPEELEEEIELLGATINVYTSNEEIRIAGTTLSRNFQKTMDLVKEILLEPRWDEEIFELRKSQNVNTLIRYEADPSFIAQNEFQKLIFGEKHVYGYNSIGTVESVQSLTIDDLKNYYNKYFSPSTSSFLVAGAIDQNQVVGALKDIDKEWKTKEVKLPEYAIPAKKSESKIYFYDMPGAKQSIIMIGNLSIGRDNPDFYPATVMNYELGGSFNGILNMILREEKGYTYGARSSFTGRKGVGIFSANASVQSNTTLESVEIFLDEMKKYKEGIDQEGLTFTKNNLIRSNARSFESLGSLVNMLYMIHKYELPYDYTKEEENIVKNMTLAEHKKLANKYIETDKMVVLVIGDAATQLNPLKEVGLGDPVLLND